MEYPHKFPGLTLGIVMVLEAAARDHPGHQKDQGSQEKQVSAEPVRGGVLVDGLFHSLLLCVVIGLSLQDGKGPVKLFHENDPHQLVGKGEPGERELFISPEVEVT